MITTVISLGVAVWVVLYIVDGVVGWIVTKVRKFKCCTYKKLERTMKIEMGGETDTRYSPRKKWKKNRGGEGRLCDRHYDSSCMGCFIECRRLFKYKYIDRLVKKEESIAPNFGWVFHEALFEWYDTGDIDLAVEQFQLLPPQTGDSRRNRETGEVLMLEYRDEYSKEDFTFHGKPEIKFEI